MLKNTLTKYSSFKYNSYICIMEFSNKEKDKVLNQLESAFFKYRNEIEGDQNSNDLIIEIIKKDGYLKIDKMLNHERDRIYLTHKGESFKKLGGYTQEAKKDMIKKMKESIPNLIKWLIGIFTAKLFLSLFYIISK